MKPLSALSVPSRSLPFALLVCVSLAFSAPAQPGHTAGLAPLEDVAGLIATLKTPSAPIERKTRACQLLSLTGSTEAVPALAPLLHDAALAHYARTALEAIPGPESLQALRAALATTQGNLRLGVINSLGVRADREAVPALIHLCQDPARLQDGASQALIALARIGTREAAAAVHDMLRSGPAPLRPPAADATLRLAEQAWSRGDAATAVRLFEEARTAEVPTALQLAALRGSILARGDAGIPILLQSLRSHRPEEVALALRVARELSGPAATAALAAELPRLSIGLQPSLIRALADRADRSLRTSLEPLATAEDLGVRLAALEALGTVGDASSVPVLIHVLTTRPVDGPETETAATSLVRLPPGPTDLALLTSLRSTRPPALVRLLGVIAQRGTTGGTETLLGMVRNPDPAVVAAALDALGATASASDLPAVLGVATRLENAELRDRAERTLHAVALRSPNPASRTAVLTEGLRTADSAAARASILQVLGMLSDAPAAVAVEAAYADSNPQVRDASLQVLTHWADPGAIPSLIRILKATPVADHRLTALQGIVSLAAPGENPPGGRSAPPSPEIVGWITETAAAIHPGDVAERRMLVSGLGDLNCAEGLRLLAPHLSEVEVRSDAQAALLRCARRLSSPMDKTEAANLIRHILDSGEATAEFRQSASAVLTSLGSTR